MTSAIATENLHTDQPTAIHQPCKLPPNTVLPACSCSEWHKTAVTPEEAGGRIQQHGAMPTESTEEEQSTLQHQPKVYRHGKCLPARCWLPLCLLFHSSSKRVWRCIFASQKFHNPGDTQAHARLMDTRIFQ